MNIKLLPNHYILKRWTREARSGTIQDISGRGVIENPKLDAVLRHKFLSRKFINLANKASGSEECCTLIENALDSVEKEVEAKLKMGSQSQHDEGCDTQAIPRTNELLTAARLKKKSPRKKTSKRKRTWVEKFHKKKKTRPSDMETQELPKVHSSYEKKNYPPLLSHI